MSDLLAARSQMAMSLAFHIVFACVGMAMPLLMVLAERRWLRRGDPADLELARRWSKGVAILFAVGAVSGTVLSFKLGLLWPTFMRFAGPIVGMPFSLEGFAFFLEAIGLGLYLYGWKRLSPRVHLATGVLVLVSGIASAVFVVCANGWMNTPTGFTRDAAGAVLDVDPIAAMLNPAALIEGLHMVIAALVAVGFGVAAIHAWRLLKHPGSAFDRRALALVLPVAAIAALLQPLAGDLAGHQVAATQPVKLAAMEALWDSQRCAPMTLGGFPDEDAEVTHAAMRIPCLLSLLTHHDPDALIVGLKDVPRALRPPVAITHYAYQLMVLIGMLLAGVGVTAGVVAWRRKTLVGARWLLRALVVCGPLGFVAVEAGWVVTEVGRQPWVIQGVLKTADAVTPMPGIGVPFALFTVLYLVLAVVCVVLLRRHVFRAPVGPDASDGAPIEVGHDG